MSTRKERRERRHLLRRATDPERLACAYGVHSNRYEGIFKICVRCGATYLMTTAEMEERQEDQ